MRYAACSDSEVCIIATPGLLRHLDRRLLISSAGALAVILILAGVGYALRPASREAEVNFYTPGVTPKREDCVLSKMKTYAKIDKLTLQSIAMECELTVQSIEGHEKLRQAWQERQAVRDALPKPVPAAEPAPAAEGDRLRRVWR
ncbi:MAG: hypothetical protein VW600_01765 [Ferrovibrio sp.]